MNKREQTEGYCCTTSGIRILEGQYCQVEWGKASLVRSMSSQSCRTNGRSYRLGSMIPENQENQPGATMYLRSMPVAAVAMVEKATYHTAVAERRDDCSMARLKVPGFALAISTGDPAFRFKWSSPKRTMRWS